MSLAINSTIENTPRLLKRSSPFELLIQSRSINRVETINISQEEGNIEIRVSLLIHDDYRVHWVLEVMQSANEAHLLLDTLIDTHAQQHDDDSHEMDVWREELNNPEAFIKGISLYMGSH